MKLNSKYRRLFENRNDVRYYIITGGRGSGKSFGATLALVQWLTEIGQKILFTRYTMTSASKSIIPEFMEKIDLLGLTDEYYTANNSVTNINNGSSIMFSGIKTGSGNQTAALKSLHGVRTWVLDEAEELTDEDEFNTIDLSIRDKSGLNRVVLMLNPVTRSHWIYTRFFEEAGVPDDFNGIKDGVCYINTNYLDNAENLHPSFIANAKRMKLRRPDKYLAVMLGAWLKKAEGVIFDNWKVGDYVEGSNDVFGQDYGFSIDPTTLLQLNIDKDLRKMYVKEIFCKPKLTTTQIFDLNEAASNGRTIYGDSAEPRLINELNSMRMDSANVVPVKKGAGSILEGIKLMQDYDMIIDESSVNLIRELNNYQWAVKKATPIDANNHCIDALRYGLVMYLKNPNAGEYYL